MSHPGTAERRELFWQNVIREILSTLASAAASSGGRLGTGAKAAATGAAPQHELFDGRLAVMTRLGQRIPIADVFPVFACSMNPSLIPGSGSSGQTPREQALAADVQCTVFQIRTPTGEVFTLPLHEIVGFHALSESLLQSLAARAQGGREPAGGEDSGVPFGFAAFTSLARSQQELDAAGPETE